MLTTDAPENPYSALKFVCSTLNSSIASGDGTYVAAVMPPLGSEFVTEAPSVRMSAVDPRLPLETKFVPVQVASHWSSISVTPGAREVNAITLRSINGRSLMNRRLTTWPVSASSVATPCAAPCTSTVCVEAPTFSVKFAVAFSLTSTFILGRIVFSNPGISAVTEYTPGGTDRNKYDPFPSEVVWNVNPFC